MRAAAGAPTHGYKATCEAAMAAFAPQVIAVQLCPLCGGGGGGGFGGLGGGGLGGLGGNMATRKLK